MATGIAVMRPAMRGEPLGRLLAPAFRFSQLATVSTGWLSAAVKLADFGIFEPAAPGIERRSVTRDVIGRFDRLAEGHFVIRHRGRALEWDAALICLTIACGDGLGFGWDQFIQRRNEAAQRADGAQVLLQLAPVIYNAITNFMD